jgi:hypothetical protein
MQFFPTGSERNVSGKNKSGGIFRVGEEGIAGRDPARILFLFYVEQ